MRAGPLPSPSIPLCLQLDSWSSGLRALSTKPLDHSPGAAWGTGLEAARSESHQEEHLLVP